MGLTLQSPPGFADLANSALAQDQPAFGINLAKIAQNAAFGKVRVEVFQEHYQNGDTVPTPVSPIDGYVYSRNELMYVWAVESTADLATGWMSDPQDTLWYCAWKVDQSTGQVFSDEWYRTSGNHYNPVHTNDGVLRVFTIAQRQLASLVMATAPSYSAVTAGWMAQDAPFSQQLAQGLNGNAKFSVVNREVFYLGEYYNAQTVPMPVSPIDGYHYSAAECQFQFSWRWTSLGNTSQLTAPQVFYGQLASQVASVNSSGVVTCLVSMVHNDGAFVTHTDFGRIAVFAFCTRTGTPSGLASPLTGFSEISYDNFMPGSVLPFDSVSEVINEDILEAIGTPEFFGPTVYHNGDVIPRPVSVIDPSYTYPLSELTYIYEISDTTNASGSHLRVPIWFSSIAATGLVFLNVWREPPGGPQVPGNYALGTITVMIVARRQAQAATAITPGSTNPSQDSQSNTPNADIPTVSTLVGVPAVGSINSSNQAFTLASSATIIFLVWNGQVRFDFTQSSPPSTSFSTTFTPDTGDTLYAVVST